jgi:hypothetical protein
MMSDMGNFLIVFQLTSEGSVFRCFCSGFWVDGCNILWDYQLTRNFYSTYVASNPSKIETLNSAFRKRVFL